MPSPAGKPVIFISYSHKDRAWLDYVRSFFAPLAKHWTLTIWDDEKLRIGDDWRGDIYSALGACDVFLLLVSRYALASDFIIEEEVGRVLKRPKGEVQFCPLVLTPYFAKGLDWLDQPNRRPKDGKALSELQDPERDREIAVIAEQIDDILRTVASRKGAPAIPSTPPIAFPSIVDYGRLPETPYKVLVGRDGELRRLDDAWANGKVNVISLVARGGVGKTSLVIEWLVRLRKDSYRNADAVLCWSFYSQGTKERAASGEGFLDWALAKLKVKLDTTSSSAKGERLAEEMSRRRVLLVLDGVEPLQHGPEGQEGAFKDQGLRTFLRRFSAMPSGTAQGLVVLTSRLAVHDLGRWKDTTAPVIDLGRLSDEAGAALLADSGVKGSPAALKDAAHDFAGHALALSLLAGFLRYLRGGDISQRSHVRPVIGDPNAAGDDHARRVLEAYEKEWLAREPVLLAIMHLIGLFDRPASADCLAALRRKPAIDGLTNAIIDIDDASWRATITRLRDARLLDPEDPAAPDALDAHPLVREWFGERLKATNEAAWKAAHGRLYEHLRDATKEGKTPTLEDLAPLYQAIAHGCRAGHHSEALDKIYTDRICRWRPDGNIEFYARRHLGAFGSDLAAISWFFADPYGTPVATLSPAGRAWVLGDAASLLQAQGRFVEALPAHGAALRMCEAAKDWVNASVTASNLSRAELLVGEVSSAIATAERSVAHADRSGAEYVMMCNRTTHADALHAAGQRGEAARAFADAERRQKQWQPEYPLLYSLWGYHYCDFLLTTGDRPAARDRATKILEWEVETDSRLDRALVRLAIDRAHLGLALATIDVQQTKARVRDGVQTARTRLNEAVDGLRTSGHGEFVPRGLLARAAFRRSAGDWDGAARDLDEVEEIAEPGPMRLFLCDMALERARLAFAKLEAFAPLNGLIDDSPPKPELPGEAERKSLHDEAAKQLAIAAEYIEKCGYHKRDEELAELQAVLRGERTFASLPPRV